MLLIFQQDLVILGSWIIIILMNEKNHANFNFSSPFMKVEHKVKADLYDVKKERNKDERSSDAIQLKIQMMYSRLVKKQTQKTFHDKSSPILSKSKTSKLTFACHHNQRLSVSEKLLQLKQRMQNQFQFQFEILTNEYRGLAQAHVDYLNEKQRNSHQTKSQIETMSISLRKMKETSLSGPYLKIYSQNINKKPAKKRVNQTPFRLSLTPFQKQNSLLISVKRSLGGFNGYSTSKKPDRQVHNADQSYKYSQNNPNFTDNLNNQREKESFYKDFIKQTQQEDENNLSFDAIQESIVQKMHLVVTNYEKKVQKNRMKIQKLAQSLDQLGKEISQQARICIKQWRDLEFSLKQQLETIAESLNENKKNSKAAQRQRQDIFALMQQSIDDVLASQRNAYRIDHTAIIENLHQVISIFQ